jgi:hypothetical protein
MSYQPSQSYVNKITQDLASLIAKSLQQANLLPAGVTVEQIGEAVVLGYSDVNVVINVDFIPKQGA